MAKKSNASKAAAQKAPASESGQYRAKVAFALDLDRVERGSIVVLTAEQAAALGNMVESIAPVAKVQEQQNTEAGDGSANDQEQGDASTDASGSDSAAASGDAGADNQDQIV